MENRKSLDLALNVGHALDHLMMLIFPTVVLAIGTAWGRGYGELLPLALGGFVAFGAFSLPAGWLADHWSRTGMMKLFFFGIGAAAIATGFATGPVTLAIGLTLIGMFAAIYHPVGIAMLVSGRTAVGRTLGVNGVFGNSGLAFAALIAGALAHWIDWRAAFFVPGLAAIVAGFWFSAAAANVKLAKGGVKKAEAKVPRSVLARVFVVVAVATAAGGVVFNATTVAMPKVFAERLAALTETTFGIGALVCAVYLIAAMAQLAVGWWLDRRSLRAVFLPVAAAQVPLLWLAGSLTDYAMLAGALAMMFFVFGQIPINDAMIARYTAEEWRARAYSVRYVVSFGASALAVPLIAWTWRTEGDFRLLFTILAGVACLTFAAALAFPGERAVRAAPAPSTP